MAKRKTQKPHLRLVRKLDGFFAETHLDAERIAIDYPIGQVYEVEFKRPRSLPRLRLYWAILHFVHANDPYGYASPEKISEALKVETGHSTPTRRLSGEIVMEPDSIAFDKMGEETFRKYFDHCLQLIEAHWGIDIDTLLREGKKLNAKIMHFPNKSKKDVGTEPYQTEIEDGAVEAA